MPCGLLSCVRDAPFFVRKSIYPKYLLSLYVLPILKIEDMKKVIATPDAPKAVGPYSQAIEVNGTLYISGQIPVNPADGKVQEDIVAAAHQSLKNIGAILKEAGMTYDNVVKTTVLLADIADFKAVNEVYAEYFTGDKPARACYQAAALPLGVKVEIEAIAVK